MSNPKNQAIEVSDRRVSRAIFDGIQAAVKNVGWAYVSILEPVPFVYTIGLSETRKHPELLVSGLAPNMALVMISNLIARIAGPEGLPVDQPIASIAASGPVILKKIANPKSIAELAAQALKADFEMLQCVWPDPAGKLPWEDGYDRRFDALQKPFHEGFNPLSLAA
jgi:hypothetical protein